MLHNKGTAGTSSLGEFWRQEFGKCRGRETDEVTDPSLNHPLTMPYMGAGSGREKGWGAGIFALPCQAEVATPGVRGGGDDVAA
jgi:hypothetical protein